MFAVSDMLTLRPEDCGYSQALKEILEIEQGKSLNLDRLHLETLPVEIRRLGGSPNLQRVDLSHNNFTSLPPEIGLLNQIKEFKLCSNMRIPFSLPSVLGNLVNLVNLKLSRNSLSSIPEEIGKLTNLFMIDLGHNNLTKLPKSFSNLTNLLELRLEYNKLEKFPSLGSKLKFLSISFNVNFKNLSKCIEKIVALTELHHLEMRACEITEWPTTFSSLTKLQHLDLGCNRISNLPDRCLLQFPLLQNLYLDHNQLTEIPDDIGKLTTLSRLILAGNDFQEIPLSFRHLVNLQDFSIDEENMLIPPREVVRNGLYSIRSFIESLAEESLPCYRIRLLVLGSELSGKTSLIRRIRSGKSLKKKEISPPSQQQQNNNNLNNKYIDSKVIKISTKQSDGKNISVEFNTWDFSNEIELFHQFFVASKSIFIITVDLRDISKSKLRYWLESISSRADLDSPIFIVGTHSDDKLFKDDGAIGNVLNIIAQEYGSKFSNIKLITSVSSYDGNGIDELRNALVNSALNLKHVGRIIPKPYNLLEDAIKLIHGEKLTSNYPPIISWKEYTTIAAKCHIHTDTTLRSATSFLRDLGIVITFPDANEPNHLTPLVVFDQNWICELAVSN